MTGSQLVKKFPTFYGNRMYITAFSSVGHLSLSWTRSTLPPHPTSWRSILILSSHLRLCLSSGPLPQVSTPNPCIHISSPHSNSTLWRIKTMKLLLMPISQTCYYSQMKEAPVRQPQQFSDISISFSTMCDILLLRILIRCRQAPLKKYVKEKHQQFQI